ncbi:hypothetical protein K1719_028967 [Acacia pycnantha]|nr:hypothetical protein K1719_028967 [Acacia pycnantha]
MQGGATSKGNAGGTTSAANSRACSGDVVTESVKQAAVTYRSNRATALTGLGQLAEAVRECEEAVRLDPNYGGHISIWLLFF